MSGLVLLGMLVRPLTMLEIEKAAGIPDQRKRDVALGAIANMLVDLGAQKADELASASEPYAPEAEAEVEPETQPALSVEPPALPSPADETERLIDRIAEVCPSVENGYRDLKQLWTESKTAGTWTDAHTARAARRRADIEARFAVQAVTETLGGKVA